MKYYITSLLLIISIKISCQISDFKHINFDKADNTAALLKGESLQNLPLLTHNLTANLKTDAEKFRAIYSWICNNIKGDYYIHKKVSRKRNQLKNDSISYLKWNKNYTKTVYKNLLKNKKTMCTGYAYLLKNMANIIDIECLIIDGYGRNSTVNSEKLEAANHSWNAVKINNKWYLADATWSSGSMDEKGSFLKVYNDGYFLTEPILFAKNHFPLDKKWLLNKSTTEDSFINSPIVYGELFKYKLIADTKNKIDILTQKNQEVIFSFKSLKDNTGSKISLVKYYGNKERDIKIYDIKNNKNEISFKTIFKNKGYYNIHLKIDQDIVITYNLEVVNKNKS